MPTVESKTIADFGLHGVGALNSRIVQGSTVYRGKSLEFVLMTYSALLLWGKPFSAPVT